MVFHIVVNFSVTFIFENWKKRKKQQLKNFCAGEPNAAESTLLHNSKGLFLFYDLTRKGQYNKTLNHKSGETNKRLRTLRQKAFCFMQPGHPLINVEMVMMWGKLQA